jgi:excisionase family DNA binding protein
MRLDTDTDNTPYYRLLSKKDVADLLQCTERTVDRLVTRNQIPFTRIPWGTGGKLKRRFIFGDIVEWMKRHAGGLTHQNAEEN